MCVHVEGRNRKHKKNRLTEIIPATGEEDSMGNITAPNHTLTRWPTNTLAILNDRCPCQGEIRSFNTDIWGNIYFFYTQVNYDPKLGILCMATFNQVSLIFDNYEMLYYPEFDTANHR